MIYFIATEDMLFVKIGYTGKITRDRFNYCQAHCPYKLILLLFIQGDLIYESELHRMFAKYRKRNEWFHLSDAIQQFVKENRENHIPYKQSARTSASVILDMKKDYLINNMNLDQVAIKYQRTKRAIQGVFRRNKIRKR